MRTHLQTSNGAKGRNCCQNLATHRITRVVAASGRMQPLLRMSSLRKPPGRPSRVFREYFWLSSFQADSRAPPPGALWMDMRWVISITALKEGSRCSALSHLLWKDQTPPRWQVFCQLGPCSEGAQRRVLNYHLRTLEHKQEIRLCCFKPQRFLLPIV